MIGSAPAKGGARQENLRHPDLCPLASAEPGKPDHPFFARKATAIQNAPIQTTGNSLTTNSTNLHEWGAASPENFLAGIIRVHACYSWIKSSVFGHPVQNRLIRFPGGSGYLKLAGAGVLRLTKVWLIGWRFAV
jgi:hypothetical protein